MCSIDTTGLCYFSICFHYYDTDFWMNPVIFAVRELRHVESHLSELYIIVTQHLHHLLFTTC